MVKNYFEKAIDQLCEERGLTRVELLKALPWLKAGLQKGGEKPSG